MSQLSAWGNVTGLRPDWSPAEIYDRLAVLAWKRGDKEAHRLYRQQEEAAKAATFVFQRCRRRNF